MPQPRSGAPFLAATLALLAPACADDLTLDRETVALKTPTVSNGEACVAVTGAVNIAVPRVQVSGEFTINGAAPTPYDSQTGVVELRSDRLGVVELGPVHEGSYSRWIIPGTYRVVYRHTQGTLVPQNADSTVIEEVVIDSNTDLDIALTSVLATGAITIGGAPAPGGLYQHGQLLFRDRDTGAAFPVGSSVDGEYSAMVMPGSYDVVWSHVAGAQVPSNQAAVLVENVTVAGLTELDIDVPVAQRTGAITIDGQAPSTGLYENGALLLRNPSTGDLVPLGQTRDQSYSALIVPGTYDVLYAHIIGSTLVPRNELAVVATNVVLTGPGDLAIDIPTVNVSGALTLDGARFPAGFYDHAQIWLQGAEPTDRFPVGSTLAASYQMRVVAGSYDVAYEGVASTGQVPENPWTVLSHDHWLTKSKGIAGPGAATLDVEVASAWLTADVTMWGESPPQGFYEQGELRATAEGDHAGPAVTLGSLIDAEPARVLAGAYDLHYGHVAGTTVPLNGNALVANATAWIFAQPVAIDLQSGAFSGQLSQGNHGFPTDPAQHGAIYLRDVTTGDEVPLADTVDGGFGISLLSGTYDVVYDHIEGSNVVANHGAVVGCVEFAPPAPAPKLTRVPKGRGR